MRFRARLQIAFVLLAVLSVGCLAVGVRFEMARRLAAEYERRVGSLIGVIRDDLAQESEDVGRRLRSLARALANDNRFRLGAADTGATSIYVLDYAREAMRLAGLSMLHVQDSAGRIVSSGHFRNEFGRVEPELPRLLGRAPGNVALLDAATPEGSFLVLARADSTRLGDRRLHVIGGRTVGREFLRRLAREGDLLVTLRLPDGETLTSDVRPDKGEWAVADQVRIPFVAQPDTGAPRLTQAALVVSYSLSPLVQLRQSAERWSVAAGLLAVLLAIVLGGWVAGRVSRPLTDLARKTAALDLTRLDVDFASERGDEVGTLAGVLAALGARLRKDAQRLRLAERRAAVGEFARQVNHDVKNGLVPIRNALRHLTETADQRPEELRRVFHERKATLDSGVRYLEKLAVNYARLSSRDAEGSADVRAVVDDVLGGAETGTVAVRSHIPASLPLVRGDPVVLRRILENLLTNAVDACLVNGGGRAGQVVVSAEWVRNEDAVRLAVKDTGVGMSVAQLERAFEDFYTTKPGGTGLGLTIVRRLVTDLDGSLKVTTVPGWGTTVEVKLPRAPAFRARPVGRT